MLGVSLYADDQEPIVHGACREEPIPFPFKQASRQAASQTHNICHSFTYMLSSLTGLL